MLRNTLNLLGLVAALLLAGTTAQGSLIGFNFSGGWQSGPFNLAASDTAGVVPQQNWNNWMGAGGQSNQNYTNIALVDNTGAASTAKAQIGPYFFQNDGPAPGNGTSGGIQTLYGGKTREGNGNNWTATFSAIPYLKYDVYAYTAQNATIAISGAATGNGSQTLTYGGSIASYVQGSNYLKWSSVSGTSFTIASTSGGYSNVNAFQIVQASKPIISKADGGWGDGTTWDLDPTTPVGASDYDVTVRHAVSFVEAAQVVSSLILDNGNSNMTIPVGASLTGGTDVQLGTLTVNGGLTATTLKVSGGSATMAGGSLGTIPTVNVTAGSATLNGGTIGTLNASGGTTGLGVNLGTALAVSGTGTVNTTAAVTVPIVTVAGTTSSLDTSGGALSATTVAVSGGTVNLQGGTIGTVNASGGTTTLATNVTALNLTGTALVLGGGGGGAGTAVLKTGSTLNTQINYLAVGTSIKLNDSTVIAVSGGTFDIKGADVGAKTISNLKLNGGTVTISGPPAAAVFGSTQNSGWLSSAATQSYNGVNFTPGANGMLIAMVGGEGSPSITSVSWTPTGGMIVAMTQAVKQNSGNVLSGIWYLASPALGTGSGTGTLSYVLTGTTSRSGIGAVYATGVDQLAVPASATVSGNFPQTAGPIAAALGSLVVSSGINGTTGVTGGIVGGGDTSLWNLTGNTGMGASYKISTGGTESGQWNTPTSTGIANIASFGSAGAAPFSVNLSSTILELTADTTLDIGLATSASFFDLVLAPGVTTNETLRIMGSNWGAVSGLASFFDVTAPNNAFITLGETNGTTYQDVVVMPEPATLAFVALGGLGLLLRRRRPVRSL